MGTYPPRACGIATFNQDLLNSSQLLLGGELGCKAAAMNILPVDTYLYPPEALWQIDQNNKREYAELARSFNDDPLIRGIIIQHEYGIFGGKYGENILAFCENCIKPVIVTLHTVLPQPKPKMKAVTERIISGAAGIVVLTDSSKKILEATYGDALGKVTVIAHGIHDTAFDTTELNAKKLKLDQNIILTTFGLLSRGKGIEYVIKALPEVVKKYPQVRYLILGETHPLVRRKEGERYRLKLIALAKQLGLKKQVKFYEQYFSIPNLLTFLKATEIYISTSINPNQAVSGTLSYALGTGRAVISTNFAQAREIINEKTGRLVPLRNSGAFTRAILDLLEDQPGLKQMHRNAYSATRHMVWGNVAKEYLHLLAVANVHTKTAERILPPLKLNHLKRMTDDFGLFQFATEATPNKAFGYTLDDNARALVVCSWLAKQGDLRRAEKLMKIYMAFIKKCQLESGAFINYLDYPHHKVTRQNQKENLEEANARALWALAEVLGNQTLSKQVRDSARSLLLKALPQTINPHFNRSRSFIIKALVQARESFPKKQKELDRIIEKQADFLLTEFGKNSTETWRWFEPQLTYNNGILPESLFWAGKALDNSSYTQTAIITLEFLIRETFKTDCYAPIGQAGWHKRGGKRSEYDQQPEDPASMSLALVTAYKMTGNEEYCRLAYKCFTWFLGNNQVKLPMYDQTGGGCYDGLKPDRVNLNQGAESQVSYLLSRLAVARINAR